MRPNHSRLSTMGITASATAIKEQHEKPNFQIEDVQRNLFASLGFSTDNLNKFHVLFQEMDENKNGTISVDEFISFFGLSHSAFTYRAFALVNSNRSGAFNFSDFIVTVWNYCSFTHDGLMEYAFALYDADCSEEIDLEEAQMLVHEVWGEAWERSEIAQIILQKLKELMEVSTMISLENFKKAAVEYPEVLYPAYQMQRALRERVLGTNIWRKIETHRKSINDPSWRQVHTKLFTMATSTDIHFFAFDGRIAKLSETNVKNNSVTYAAKKWINRLKKKKGPESATVVPEK